MDAPASTESSELSLFTQSVRLEKKPLGESRHFIGPHCSFESPVATVTNLNHRFSFTDSFKQNLTLQFQPSHSTKEGNEKGLHLNFETATTSYPVINIDIPLNRQR